MELNYPSYKPKYNIVPTLTKPTQVSEKTRAFRLPKHNNTPRNLQPKIVTKQEQSPFQSPYLGSLVANHTDQYAFHSFTEASESRVEIQSNFQRRLQKLYNPIRIYPEEEESKLLKRRNYTEFSTEDQNYTIRENYSRLLETLEEENTILYSLVGTPMRKNSENLPKLTISPTNAEYAIKKRSVSVSKRPGINPAVLYFSSKGANEIKKPLQLFEGAKSRRGSKNETPELLEQPKIAASFRVQKIKPQDARTRPILLQQFNWTKKLPVDKKGHQEIPSKYSQELWTGLKPSSRNSSNMDAFEKNMNSRRPSAKFEKSLLSPEKGSLHASAINKTQVTQTKDVQSKGFQSKAVRNNSPPKNLFRHNGKLMLLPATIKS